MWAFCALALVVLAGTGALAARPVTASDGITESGGVKTYTDPDYGYSFRYPADWQLQKDPTSPDTTGDLPQNAVSVFDPEGSNNGLYYFDLAGVEIYELGFVVDDSTMPDLMVAAEAMAEQDPTWGLVEPAAPARIDGLSGYQTTYWSSVEGVPTMSRYYVLMSDTLEYHLLSQAATANWQGQQTAFDAILDSFAASDN